MHLSSHTFPNSCYAYIYIYTHTHTCIYICVYIYTHVLHIDIQIYLSIFVYLQRFISQAYRGRISFLINFLTTLNDFHLTHYQIVLLQLNKAIKLKIIFKLVLSVSVQFTCSVVFDPLQPHESQDTRHPCPSPTPGVYSNSSSASRRYHPAISSSVIPFSSCLQSLPASGSFPMSQLLA